jgi:hypothetical protein
VYDVVFVLTSEVYVDQRMPNRNPNFIEMMLIQNEEKKHSKCRTEIQWLSKSGVHICQSLSPKNVERVQCRSNVKQKE